MAATLYFIYEPEEACRVRLAADGFATRRALEISSYLAQSTDLQGEFEAIEAACFGLEIAFRPLELDSAAETLARADPSRSLVWTVTDGVAYFRGSVIPMLARLHGHRVFGSDETLFSLCQDKFRAGAVLRALGIDVPEAGLARGGTLIVDPPPSRTGYFVKPNRLGSKIGIWPHSHCRSVEEALALSQHIHDDYRDDAIIQPYVEGRNIRASFLGVDPESGMERLGVFVVDSHADFQTMDDSLALYGETGQAAQRDGRYLEPDLIDLGEVDPQAKDRVRAIARHLQLGLGLRDVFSLDFRIEPGGRVHLIEFEVCPGLPCFDFRAYLKSEWALSMAEAIATTASRRLTGR